MKLPEVFSRYRTDLNLKLRSVLAKGDLPMYDMLRYHMGWLDEDFQPTETVGGKAIRPSLCLFSCEAVGGHWPDALAAAVAIELIHNFSLIHDDIQDGDTKRHHRPTVWYCWGHSHGLNAGAAMNVLANQALLESSESALPTATVLKVSQILTNACAQMIEGQVLDLTYEQKSTISVDDYLLMISKKTGALLECSLQIGSTIGTNDQAKSDGMRRFGKGIGLLFQVRDDMLGVWGLEETTGKPTASDLRGRKNSLPVVHALWHGKDTPSGNRFATIYRKKDPLADQEVTDLLTILDEMKSHQFCERIAGEQANETLSGLDTVDLTEPVRAECQELVTFLCERDF